MTQPFRSAPFCLSRASSRSTIASRGGAWTTAGVAGALLMAGSSPIAGVREMPIIASPPTIDTARR